MLVLRVRFRVRVTVRVGVKDAQGTKRLGTKKYGTKCLEASQNKGPDVIAALTNQRILGLGYGQSQD